MKRLAAITAAAAAIGFGTAASAAPVFVIDGFGWGHGIGLSQYGASGLASRGATHAEILSHYYQGTSLGTADVARIRVLVSAPAGPFEVASTAPFTVRGSDGVDAALPADAVTVTRQLAVTVGPDTHKLVPPLTFVPGEAPLSVAGRAYRGKLNVHDTVDGVLVVNDVGLEQYLYGVIADEMPPAWEPEALKAQAVAARSYAIATRRAGGIFDAYDDTRSQVYGGLASEDARATGAVDATQGQVVLHEGKVATTFFFSTSGGRTAAIEDVWRGSAAVPYLRAVDDPTDAHSPYHRWGPLVLSRKQLQQQLSGHAPRGVNDITTTTNSSGRVDLFVMSGPRGQAAIDGATARTALGLRSTGFRFAVIDLAKPTEPVAFRQKLVVRGLARNAGRVTLEARTERGWEPVRELKSKADGTLRAGLRPTASMTLRLTAPALEGSGVRAPQIRVDVRARVTLERKRRGIFAGLVHPKEAGTAVALERRGKRGWRRVARAETAASGRYRMRLRSRPPGEYRAVATPGTSALGVGTSETVSVAR